jgi:hypothetical protein
VRHKQQQDEGAGFTACFVCHSCYMQQC